MELCIAIALCLFALVGAAAPAGGGAPDGELIVVLFRGTPCRPEAAARVTIEESVRIAHSDSLGIARFAPLAAGDYRVTIAPRAASPLTRHVRVVDSGRTVLAVDVTAETGDPR